MERRGIENSQDIISIIIPVYNVQEYLPACLDSVLNQTYTALEVILVDDGTPDQSGVICEQYAEKDRRITVIHKENGGLSSARNAGLKIAHGDWILFVDSDDIIPLDACENMLRIARETSADIVVTRMLKFHDTIPVDIKMDESSVQTYNTFDILLKYFYRTIPGYACGKLISRSVMGDITFPEGKLFEDTFTVPILLERADKTAVTEYLGYYYRYNPNGIVNSSFSPAKLDILDAIEISEAHFAGYGMDMERAIASKGFVASVDLLGRMQKTGNMEATQNRVISKIKQTRKVVFRDKNNSYFCRIMAMIAIISPELTGVISGKRDNLKSLIPGRV